MSNGAWVAVVAVVVALVFGAWRLATDGRFRGTRAVATPEVLTPEVGAVPVREPEATTSLLDGTPWADRLGERATLLQFSSAFCAPCRATRQVLADVAEAVPGVVHVEVDAEQHLDVVRRLAITRTPTTLVLGARGDELARAAGAPRKEQVLAALGVTLD